MLCVSAVFAVVRCRSVSLSVTLVDCIQMAKDDKLPSRTDACTARYCHGKSVRPSVCHTLVSVSKGMHISSNSWHHLGEGPSLSSFFFFSSLLPLQISEGNSLSVGVTYTWAGKFGDFRPRAPVFSETVRNRPMITTDR